MVSVEVVISKARISVKESLELETDSGKSTFIQPSPRLKVSRLVHKDFSHFDSPLAFDLTEKYKIKNPDVT